MVEFEIAASGKRTAQFLINRGDGGERLLWHKISNIGLHVVCQFDVASSAFW